MDQQTQKFIQEKSPDGGFLQSEAWRKFQENTGRRTFHVEQPGFWANIVEHKLPLVGRYFYIPRGPLAEIINNKLQITNKDQNLKSEIQNGMEKLIELAKNNDAGWIRIEPNDSKILDNIRKNSRTVKAPHDMQPREIFIIDIKKTDEEILAEMKSKTRYNIRLAEKKGVSVKKISNYKFQITNKSQSPNDQNSKYYIDEFLRLVKITAKRDNIVSHPESYYRKMFEAISGDILKLYVAEYEQKIIAANIVIFYGATATYLHGASDSEHRNVMAPYLLQWQQIKDAKAVGCSRYDFGGVATKEDNKTKAWAGITRFKLGFSSTGRPVEFPGSYDIIINGGKYFLYDTLRKVKKYF